MKPPRKQGRRSTVPKKAASVEWIGGMDSMPAHVTGEGEPYRPAILIWMRSDGIVLGTELAKPGELLPKAGASLRSTIERPLVGRPHSPTRVRVASPELAEALRAEHPGLDVVCAPTPELDAVLAAMREMMDIDATAEPSYLSAGVDPDAVASLFEAAAALFRARPWRVVPDDQSLFSVTIERLGIRDAALAVIGQIGESFGFILFSNIDDFESYLAASDVMTRGESPTVPPHLVLNFEGATDLPPELRREVAEHRWEIAAPDAYPWLFLVGEGLAVREPTTEEMSLAEAVARALTQVISAEEALGTAWSGGAPISHTVAVQTYHGAVDVTLRAPFERAPIGFDRSRDLIAELANLPSDDGEIDQDSRKRLEAELLRRFAASPEASGLEEIFAADFVMDLAANHLGRTIDSVEASDLHEVVFDLIPRKVSIGASEARSIVEELRAFYAFLKREFGLRPADDCQKVLSGDAVSALEAALSDTSKFGLAKSFFMGGREASFDMDSRDGIEAWMRSIQGQPPLSSIPTPPTGAPGLSEKAAAAKKNKRKAARKTRKKNR
jgi:hypothetical protein